MRQTNRPRLCGGGGEAKGDEILIWCRRLARSPPTWNGGGETHAAAAGEHVRRRRRL